MVFFQIGNRAAIGEIFVIARKEKDEIAGRAHIELRQELRPLRPNAANELHRRRQRFGRRLLAVGADAAAAVFEVESGTPLMPSLYGDTCKCGSMPLTELRYKYC